MPFQASTITNLFTPTTHLIITLPTMTLPQRPLITYLHPTTAPPTHPLPVITPLILKHPIALTTHLILVLIPLNPRHSTVPSTHLLHLSIALPMLLISALTPPSFTHHKKHLTHLITALRAPILRLSTAPSTHPPSAPNPPILKLSTASPKLLPSVCTPIIPRHPHLTRGFLPLLLLLHLF